MSQVTTVVTTTGNSNGFHLDSTHCAIRRGAGGQSGRGGERKQQKDLVVGREGRSVFICIYVHHYTLNVHYMHIYERLEGNGVH